MGTDCKGSLVSTQTYFLADFYNQSTKWWVSTIADQVVSIQEAIAESGRPPDGFGHHLAGTRGEMFLGYFSAARIPSGDAPDYARSLFLAVDKRVYGDEINLPHVALRKSLRKRTLIVQSAANQTMEVQYTWPFYRELTDRIFSDPSTLRSEDFAAELMAIVRFYRPQWIY